MMGLMVRVTYACLDGSPFPVDYAAADDALETWHLDREHGPEAMTPLADSVRPMGQPGEARAYADCDVTRLPSLTRSRPVANGYAYHLGIDLSPDEWERLGNELRRLAREHGGNAGVWGGFCLPVVQADCAWLAAAPATTSFTALAERREHAWGLTSVAGLVARVDERAVAASCADVFGERSTEVAYLLAQGSDNDTMTADRTLRELAAMQPGSPEESRARAAFVEAYGGRSTSWSIDHPTFAEEPELLDAQLRLLRRAGGQVDVGRDAITRRQRLADEVAAALAHRERATFHRRLARLESFVPVREARARWQLVASGAMRAAVRRRGQRLVEQDVLAQVDDVLFLTPAEYDEPVGDLRAVVAARRAEHARWTAVIPPASIGGDADSTASPATGTSSGAEPTLRGVAGAPGTASGTARVIRDLDDVERLEPGDVLVTTMTSPAWTPLFAIAGAVVTDAGDTLSHVAIAAREYGIPCVAGTHVATARIVDGAPITVDGDAGLVHLSMDVGLRGR
jgi:pyruvate,water dikinase